jgi:hypothetical protein
MRIRTRERGQDIRRRLGPPYPSVLLAVLLALAGSGCRATPAKSYYDASTFFAASVDALTAFRASGKIDDVGYAKLTPVIHGIDAALDEWYAALQATPEGGSPNVPRAVVSAVLSGLNELAVWQARYGKEK